MTEEEKVKKVMDEIQSANDGTTIDYVVPGYAAKKIVAYQSMREDLLLCKNAIIRLLTIENDPVVSSCLFHTVVILYGKCFTDASSSRSPKLELTDFTNAKEHLIPIHKEIMDMRHNLVAHRGSTQHDFGFAYVSLGINDLSRQVRVKQLKRNSFKIEDTGHYIELFDFLISTVEEKFHDSGVKVWRHLIDNFSPKQLSHFKIAGPIIKQG